MAKLNIAIVGCGLSAKIMAACMVINPRIKIQVCVDRTLPGARKFARLFRIKNFISDYELIFDKYDLDAVYLAVPHYLHAPMMEIAINHGVNVFCEKPATLNLKEGIHIARLADRAGIKVGINYQYRYDKGCYSLARAAGKGQLGELNYALCHLPWKRSGNYFTKGSWRGSVSKAGGGTLMTQGSHLLDIAIWAMKYKPVAALGSITSRKFKDVEVEDLAMGILELVDGSRIQITSSMTGHKESGVSLRVQGSKGSALYRGPLVPRFYTTGKKFRRELPPVKGLNAFTRSLEGFRLWIQDGLPYLCPVEESLKVLAAVEAIYNSAATGKKERVKEIIF